MKYFLVLDPQCREMVRKLAYSMEKADMPGMVTMLNLGLFNIWFFTGSAGKMEEFVSRIWAGGVFLMNSRQFLPEDLPEGIQKSELIKLLLLYDTGRHKACPDPDGTPKPIRFTHFIGDPPREKPWISNWLSERKLLQRQAVDALGAEAARSIFAEFKPPADTDNNGPSRRAEGEPDPGK